MFKNRTHSLALGFPLWLAVACGGGGGGSTAVTTQELAGVVSDPAIEGATVTLVDPSGTPLDIQSITDGGGNFTLSGAPAGDLEGYSYQAIGGSDVETGESFDGVTLSAPIELNDKLASVVSPLTSLVSARIASGENLQAAITNVRARIGNVDPAVDPSTDSEAQSAALKVSLMRKMGAEFSDLAQNLDADGAIDSDDIDTLFSSDVNTREVARMLLEEVEGNSSDPVAGYVQARVKRQVFETMRENKTDDGLDLSDSFALTNFRQNLNDLSSYIELQNASGEVLRIDFVNQVIAGAGDNISAARLVDATFDATTIPPVDGDLNLSFDDSLKEAFYTLPNTETGNDQLLVYNADANSSSNVLSNIITGNDTFIFRGIRLRDKTVIKERKFGIFLDPNASSETRTGQDSSGSAYEYNFYTDNALKRFSVTAPYTTTTLFSSADLPQALRSANISKISGSFEIYNTLADVDNSYIQLKVMESLPDAVTGEVEGEKMQAPVIVRLGDSSSMQGRLVEVIEGDLGQVSGLLVNYIAVHNDDTYPTESSQAKRLQWVGSDLSGAIDVTAGEGEFYSVGRTVDTIYLVKAESSVLYAYNVQANSLQEVSGAELPGSFDHERYFLSPGGHGTNAVLSNFSTLEGIRHSVSDGASLYLAVNYDLDASDALASIYFSPTFGMAQKTYKHGLILKLTNTTATKIYDNGDGVDHGDESDSETPVGHLSLVAVANGKLIVEQANTMVGSDFFGNTNALSMSVDYGALETSVTSSTNVFTSNLGTLDGLSYLVARRITPMAIGPHLYLTMFDGKSDAGLSTYKVYRHELNNPGAATSFDGRPFFIKKAHRPNGVIDGSLIVWDGNNGNITDVVNDVVVGNANTLIENVSVSNVFTNDQPPIAGQGTVGALNGDSADHNFFLTAFKTGINNSLKLVYGQANATWLID